MGFRAASTNIHYLTMYTNMFIELCFNFMSVFTYLSLIWSVTFFLSHHWFELYNPITDGPA
jgi:hypothetical protein